MLSQSRNLDYYNSDHLVISESMETPQVRRSMYPDIEPYDTGFLKVSDIHTVYYEQSGNPDGHVSFCYVYMMCTGLASYIVTTTKFMFFYEMYVYNIFLT